jgi:hypothetical protein
VRLEGREWRTLVSTARLGADEFRVIQPERPPSHAVLHDDLVGQQLWVDKQATVDLTIAWWLAAHSPRSLVWLPLRSSPAACGSDPGSRRLDLVLVHHRLGFRAADWKEVRGRLSAPKVHKASLPPSALPTPTAAAFARTRHRDFRDHLLWSVAAETLFITGSRLAFELEGWRLRELAEEAPAVLSEKPGAHCCAELSLGRRTRPDTYSELHVQCCNRHW